MSRDITNARDMDLQGLGPDSVPRAEPVQVAPPFPVPRSASPYAGYPLLPSRTARADIVQARERTSHLTPQAGDRTGGHPSASGSEITPATAQRYLHRCAILVNRYRRECDIRTDVPCDGDGVFSTLDPHAFVIWLLSLKPDLSAATWRFYRRVAAHVICSLPQDGVMAALNLLDTDRARHENRAGTDTRGKPGRTSPRRVRYFDRDDFTLIQRTISYQTTRSDTSGILSDWLTAGIGVGLRPLEWRATAVEVALDPVTGIQTLLLFVMNPKTTNMSGNGVMRTIDISTLSDDAIVAVHRMSARGRHWNLHGTFDDHHARVARCLTLLNRTLFPRRTVPYALYSCRHQFIANMSTILSPAEVMALTGRDTPPRRVTASSPARAWPPQTLSRHPRPIPSDVELQQIVIDITTERRQFKQRQR
ncbi:hypothetical protein SAMN05444339_1296 [Loktanella atrilutea]|uniref:Uncharacterized protein n=1 Tax=Loktanella atrilutea TaxID=366533 RepID=A0A1M5FYQ6_LOKAT|nr:hypothetical protein [Loktanella atrilutea]SHF96579.1 hypothetical protein SAMN05444339_1296 [Loktanella atrilutea]